LVPEVNMVNVQTVAENTEYQLKFLVKNMQSNGQPLRYQLQGLTLSVRTEYIYSAASQATSSGGVYILHDFH
jgi:hypothetical protein